MGKFRALLGLNLKSMLLTFQPGGNKKKSFSGVAPLLIVGFVALYLSGTYSIVFASQLSRAGLLPLLIMMMPVLAVGAGFFFSVFAAQGVVFGGKDNDLMLSLPVSSFTLLLSRVLALYLENLVFSVFVMIPAGFAYLVYGGAGGVSFVLSLLVGTVVLALLPTLLSLIAGFVFSWVSTKFLHKNLISTLLYLLLLVGVFTLSFRMAPLLEDLISVAAGLEQAFSGWGLPFILLKQAACDGSLLSLLLLCALCVGPFLLTVWAFARRYKAIVTGLVSHGARSDYRLGALRSGGPRRALLRKEAAKFFGTPIYFFNAGIGLIMLAAAGAAALLVRVGVLSLPGLSGLVGLPITALLALMMCFMLSTVGITASSISLEGKQLWIIKESPVGVWDLFWAKLGFQLLLTLPCLLLCVGGITAALGLTVAEGGLLLGLGLAMTLLTAPFGLLVNLRLPKLDAPNDAVVLKQSAASMLGILAPILLTVLFVPVYLLLDGPLGSLGALGVCLVLLVLCDAAAWLALAVKGPALFAQL